MATQQSVVAAHVPGTVTDVKSAVSAVSMPVPTPQINPTPLPAGWLEMKDPSGRTIYINSANGTTSWKRPIIRQLPPGWIKAQTPDGKPIFVNTATQQCSFQWPGEAANPPQPVQVTTTAAMPQMTRYTTTPAQPLPQTSPPAPRLVRSSTAPAKTQVQASNSALMTMTVNTAVARKTIPGFDEALAIHQLSERNNTQVLGKKLGADVAHASVALKDTTITAASLATRQAKAVGQTMVSATKMQKVSKKAIVHTGALGVKLGRASKNLMHEMVDAADGKGKYKPKVRTFVPQDPLPPAPPSQKQTAKSDAVHAYEHQQAMASTSAQQIQQAVVPVKPIGSGVPMRKPLKRPSVSVSVVPDTSHQISTQPAATTSGVAQIEAAAESHNTVHQAQQITTSEKPPRPAIEVNASLEVSAHGSLALNLSGATNNPVQQPTITPGNANTHTSPQQQQLPQQTVASPPQPTPATQTQQPASLVIQADANATLTYQHQHPTNLPPPPYSPQLQRPPRPVSSIQNQPTQQTYTLTSPNIAQQQLIQPMQPMQQIQYVTQNPAVQQQQQQQQQIIVQQPQQPSSTSDAYFDASNMLALQQQMQALQMQQQVQQMQDLQQLQPMQQMQQMQQQGTEQQMYAYQQPQLQQQQQEMAMTSSNAEGQDVYYIDNSSTNVDVGGGSDVYQQQQQEYAMVDPTTTAGSGGVVYAQETTVEMYTTTEGEVMYVEEERAAVVYEEGYDESGAGSGEVFYVEETDVQVYEVDDAGVEEVGGGLEGVCEEVEGVECAEAEVECEF